MNADLSQAARAGSDDGPAIGRKAGEQKDRAGQGDDSCEVRDFAALDFAILGVVVGVRQVVAHGGEAGAAVGVGNNFFRIESVLECPLMPHASDGGRGVDEDAVEVEEQSAAFDLGHGVWFIVYGSLR